MEIKILGTGCPSCKALFETTQQAVSELGIEAKVVKEEGKPNDLLQRIAADPAFGLSLSELQQTLNAEAYTGRARQQVEEYLQQVVYPLLQQNPESASQTAEISV